MKTRLVEQTMLVFRRPLGGATAAAASLAATLTEAPRAIAAEPPAPRLGPALEPPPGQAPAIGKAE